MLREAGAVPTPAASSLLELARELRRHQSVQVEIGPAALMMNIPSIMVTLRERPRVVLVFCHSTEEVGGLAFCTHGCRLLGHVNQLGEATSKVLRQLRS